jgi:tetratricopeptide (TPR) repeat protein
MQANKAIFKGRLDFGSSAAVTRMIPQLESRIVTFYKEDFPWKIEEILPEGTDQLVFRRLSLPMQDRTFKHALDALKWMGQFALCGEILVIYMTDKRVVQRVNPSGEKATVMYFKQAQKSSDDNERLSFLDRAIAKYKHHTEARFLRADHYIKAGNFEAALEDIQAGLQSDAENPALHLLMARHDYHRATMEDALFHIDRAIQNSMPLEEIHWKARMQRARILAMTEQYAAAQEEWQKVDNRMQSHPGLLPAKRDEVSQALAECTQAAAAL